MDNILYLSDENNYVSVWWTNIVNDWLYRPEYMTSLPTIVEPYHGIVLMDGIRTIGVEFPNEQQKTLFLLKYGG